MKRSCLIFLIATAAAVLVWFGAMKPGFSQPAEGGYAGAEKCAGCHSDLFNGWKTTRHAKAFDTLKKKSQHTLPACVKCHVTGFEKPGGYVDQELTPELADVQCEACHGPAAAHAANPMDKKNLVKNPAESLCRECHTKGQDPKFDYKTKSKFLHGRM